MTKPIIAIVGRPNVGKSTLFNKLTRTRDALVADRPGLTRDRIFGDARCGERGYIVVDTGGLEQKADAIAGLIRGQSLQAAAEADAVILLVDGREGLNDADVAIANELRRLGKSIHLAVNKTEGLDDDVACAEFFALGFGQVLPISSAHGHGLTDLAETVLDTLPCAETADESEGTGRIRLSIIGRPNVGKSTLVNRLLGEERVLVFDEPGTTRDSVSIPFERDSRRYLLIDTAGVRRRSRVSDVIERFSVIKSLQAIERSHVVLLVMDAQEGVADQDATLLGMVLQQGRALIIAVNKWDGLSAQQRRWVRREQERKLHFIDFAPVHYISALHGSGVGRLFPTIEKAFSSAFIDIPTPTLTQIVEDAVAAHPPPLVRGRRIKLRYAHQGGHNPPRVVIHGNQTDALPGSYRRYLENTVRAALDLQGTPIRIEFKRTRNPYAGKKNPLTKRQIARRKRLMRHVRNG